MSDERKVYMAVEGVVYRGRRSVHMSDNCIWIDGRQVGVEVDNNGDPIDLPEALPVVELLSGPEASRKKVWWQRAW